MDGLDQRMQPVPRLPLSRRRVDKGGLRLTCAMDAAFGGARPKASRSARSCRTPPVVGHGVPGTSPPYLRQGGPADLKPRFRPDPRRLTTGLPDRWRTDPAHALRSIAGSSGSGADQQGPTLPSASTTEDQPIFAADLRWFLNYPNYLGFLIERARSENVRTAGIDQPRCRRQVLSSPRPPPDASRPYTLSRRKYVRPDRVRTRLLRP